MSFVNSPKVEYSADGKPPDRKNWKRILIRSGLLALFIASIGLNLYAFVFSNAANRIAGTDGHIQGIVQDAQGRPIANAEITLASYPSVIIQTDSNGQFDMTNIPTGAQYLIVIHEGIGQGFVIEVAANTLTPLEPLVYNSKPAVWE
jgi:hypothetical protein